MDLAADRRLSGHGDYRSWLLPIFGVAIVVGLLLSVQASLEMRRVGRIIPFSRSLAEIMPFWLMWAVASPMIFAITRRINMTYADRPRIQIFLYGIVALVFIYVHSGLIYTSQLTFGLTDLQIPIWKGALAVARWRMPTNLLVYGTLTGWIFVTNARRRTDEAWTHAHERELLAARLSEQLATSRLHALRMQISPHFLFNSLNSVAMLVRRGEGQTAIRVLVGLSDLLRQLLADDGAPEVTLEHELAFIRQYLSIEQARFGDALRIELDVAPDTLQARVPSLILQPIVENALKHGASEAVSGGLVRITASRESDRLVLRVIDNGPGVRDEPHIPHGNGSGGLGIRNTVERLSHIHGDRFDFDLRSDSVGAVATIALPFVLARTGTVQ
jgi:two-component system, LytTR family, sensor kinase